MLYNESKVLQQNFISVLYCTLIDSKRAKHIARFIRSFNSLLSQ